MATLDELLAEITDQKTQVDNIIALVSGLHQRLNDALAVVPPTSISADAQGKIDQVFAEIKAQSDALAAAFTANTGA